MKGRRAAIIPPDVFSWRRHCAYFPEHCGFRLLSFLNRLWLQIKERRSRSHVLVGSALCVCVWAGWVLSSEHSAETTKAWLLERWCHLHKKWLHPFLLIMEHAHFNTTLLRRGDCVWDAAYRHTWITCSVYSFFLYTVVILCSVFQVEHSFNYLEIQGIACNKPTQVKIITIKSLRSIILQDAHFLNTCSDFSVFGAGLSVDGWHIYLLALWLCMC